MTFPWIAVMVKHPVSRLLFPQLKLKDRFLTWCTTNFEEGQEVWMKVDKPAKDRTHRQFKYLYSCVYPYISKEWGDCPLDVVDGVMKKRHLTQYADSPMEYVKNKTDLNRSELAKFIDDVRADAALLGIQTQDPIK